MKSSTIGLIFLFLIVTNSKAAPCDDESAPWLEIIDYEGECVKGVKVKYQCKECTCGENSKTLLCPKWVKCCQQGEIWQTNSCNICHCTEDYKRICEIAKCVFTS